MATFIMSLKWKIENENSVNIQNIKHQFKDTIKVRTCFGLLLIIIIDSLGWIRK